MNPLCSTRPAGPRGLAVFLFLLGLLAAAPAGADRPHLLGPKPVGPARRVVTLAPSITEIVLELGWGDRLVGVSRYDDAPGVKHLPMVGGFLDPIPEKILALRPDRLIVQPSPGNRGPVERLAALGVPVLVVPLHTTEEILASVRAVAETFGEREKGEALATRIASRMETIRKRNGERPGKRALIVYNWQPLVVAGPGSFADELLVLAGGENGASGTSGAYPTLSAEAALARDPAVIIDASGGHGAGKPLPGWEGRIVTPRSNALFRPGPRVIEALEELEVLLHGAGAAEVEPPTPDSRGSTNPGSMR